MRTSRVEILIPNKDGEYMNSAPNTRALPDSPVFVVAYMSHHRLGYNSDMRMFRIMDKKGADELFKKAKGEPVKFNKRLYHITFYPCRDTESARELKEKMENTDLVNAPSRMETLYEQIDEDVEDSYSISCGRLSG
jgi:hypothetical protein